MKVKQLPGDFRVEELSDVVPRPHGPFALYRLDKTGWTTPDALAQVQRRWKLDRSRIAFGGLKDRHAETSQHVTILDGPPRDLNLDEIRLTHLGRMAEPFASAHIRANRFAITVRALSVADAEAARAAAAGVSEFGTANYFDDQRFGGVGRDGVFVAKLMVLGKFEEALRLALTGEHEFDRAAAKRDKAALRTHWGDWPRCRDALPRELAGHLLRRPTDFRGACERLHPELQGLHLASYQSDIWNRMLSRWLTERLPAEALRPLRLKTAAVVVPRSVPEAIRAEWESLTMPLPSARLKVEGSEPWASIVAAVMEEEGIPLAEMRVPGVRRPFFSKGDRAGKLAVSHLSASVADDDLNAGTSKLVLSFELPRGSYATMVVKRLLPANR